MKLVGCSVVLLDDDEAWLRTLSRLLRRAGFEVASFTTPEAMFERLAEGASPDVLVIDFELGNGWNGARVAREVWKLLERSSPPLLLLSGALDTASAAEQAQFDAVLDKTVASRQIIQRLRDLSRRGRNTRSETFLRAGVREKLDERESG